MTGRPGTERRGLESKAEAFPLTGGPVERETVARLRSRPVERS